jgi:glycosyltransferase involved in cell wall biosynthesis
VPQQFPDGRKGWSLKQAVKLAIYTPSYLPKRSGAEIFHHNLAVRLSRRGHDVTVIMPRKTARALVDTRWALPYGLVGFPANIWSYYKRWPALAHAWSGWFLSNLQKRHNFDVWHGVMSFPTGVSLVHWARRRGIPHLIRSAGDDVISSQDGSIGMRNEAFIERLVGMELPRANAVVALSGSIAKEFEKMGVERSAIHEIPNAVDLRRFQKDFSGEQHAALRKSFGLNPGAFLFLAVGRNNPQKNYPSLLAAAKQLQQQGHDFQILILGRDTTTLEAEAAAMGLQGRVFGREIQSEKLAGTCPEFPPDDLIGAYRMADAFVMPSLLEGFSTALLEAMAAALPVITTDAPGCRDFVRDGRDALMTPAGDSQALANEMIRVSSDSDLRLALSAKSRDRAAQFSWESVTQRYEDLYSALVRNSNPRQNKR